jgi:hypothetical protein
MIRLAVAMVVLVTMSFCTFPSTAQDQDLNGTTQTTPESTSAILVCSCKCFTTQREVHDLEIPADGDCSSYNHLDCRQTSAVNGTYSDCRKTGVPVPFTAQ